MPTQGDIPSTRRLLRAAIAMVSFLLFVVLMMGQSRMPSAFASPVGTPGPLRGIHLGNHAYGEPWTAEQLRRIDPDLGGTWPNVIVVVSSNIYTRTRASLPGCHFQSVGIPDSHATIRSYLQRASQANFPIVIRIWPSPGNFITSTHNLNLTDQPANGNRCDDGSIPGQRGNRSYADVGDEIIKIHEWNVTHGITEAGFEPANEPNAEWGYNSIDEPKIIDPLAWSQMDAYFTAIYDYVHAAYPAPAIRVLTPPMSQSYFAETKRFGRDLQTGYYCLATNLTNDSTGYGTMVNVFLTGAKNDGYTWHNYWGTGYEAWGDCAPNASPHGHHVARFFPLLMVINMALKPRYITEADLESPASAIHWGTLTNKDDLLGFTAANSLNQFINAEIADRVAVWALNITRPEAEEPETNWHEAYRCNDWPNTDKPVLERPWFTWWWTGWPGWPALCYRTYLAGVMNNYTTELIKNGTFDAGGTYWTTTTSLPSCRYPDNYPTPIFDVIDGNNAARLGRCPSNTDTLSQTITIPDDVTSAQLTYKFRVEQYYTQPIYTDWLYVRIQDRTTGELVPLTSYNDSPPRHTWRSGISVDLTARRGHTLDVIFRATNDNDMWPTKFWLDDVSVQITH